MATELKFFYVKIKHPANEGKLVYLEQPKIVTKGENKFLTGYEIVLTKDGEPKSKITKGGLTMHVFQLGEGVEIVGLKSNLMYGNLEEAGKVEF